jgi:Domain of unknown function (DUF4160)
MFYKDHNPPHFHAEYGDDEVLIKIEDLSIYRGYLPGRALGLVIEWASEHQAELMANWENARQEQLLNKIDPLK